jgi:hypothetical protein
MDNSNAANNGYVRRELKRNTFIKHKSTLANSKMDTDIHAYTGDFEKMNGLKFY